MAADDLLDELFRNGLMDIDALGAVADLAGVDDARGADGLDREVEVGIGHHDGRGLAAQLQRDLGDVVGGRAHHGDAALDAAGER